MESIDFSWQRDALDNHYTKYFYVYVFVAVFYIPFVFLGPKLVKKGLNLKYVVQFSNFIFGTFSFAGSVVCGYGMWLLYSEGENKTFNERILNTVCDERFTSNYHGYWIMLFCASKIFELSETVVKVLQNKNIDFLHWYHHWVTFLYAWHSSVVHSSVGMWISFMNFFVHAWMYLYYFLTGMNIKPSWGIIVTFLQIVQMFLGLYFIQVSSSCSTVNMNNYYFGMAMYLSYVYLFVEFFVKKYILKSKKKVKQQEDIKKEK
eukprot:gene3231-5675_t